MGLSGTISVASGPAAATFSPPSTPTPAAPVAPAPSAAPAAAGPDAGAAPSPAAAAPPAGGALAAAVAAVADKATAAVEGATPPTPAAATPPAPAAEAPKPEAKPESPDAWRFAALNKKEKAIREEGERVKAERVALKAEADRIAADKTEREQRRATYRTNPLAALEDSGISYEDLTQFVVNNRNLTADQKLAALAEQTQRLATETDAKLKAQADDFARQQKERETAAAKAQADEAEAAKAQFMDDIRGVATAEGEKYEMVALAGAPAIQAAYERVEKHYAETGKVMTTAAALDEVEAVLYAEAERAVKASKKLTRLLAPPPAASPAPTPTPAPAPPKTLSNRMSPATGPRAVTAQASEAERRARVLTQIRQALGTG